jgi:hypothetical protein
MMFTYEAKCPSCGNDVECADLDLMGFPQHQIGDPDPLTTWCSSCGTRLSISGQRP